MTDPRPIPTTERSPFREEGQTMPEYGVILGLITLAVVASLEFLSSAAETKIGEVISAINGIGS